MKKIILSAVILAAGTLRAETYVVRDGEANTAIVIAENPPRMVALAAMELQYYLQRISGARLPIVHEPLSEVPVNLGDAVNIFVGRSRFTDGLGLSGEGLPYGAFRMVSGPDWLVLLGHDRDFLPPEPFRRAMTTDRRPHRGDRGWPAPPRRAHHG